MVGMAVVPTDKVGRGIDTSEVFAFEAKLGVAFTSKRVDDLMVVRVEVLDLDVTTKADVAKEPEAFMGRDLVVDLDDTFDLLVIGRDAATHQTKRHWQAIEQVHGNAGYTRLEQCFGGVERCWAGAHNCNAPGRVGLSHGGGS